MLGSKKEIRQKILLERSSLSQQKINIASRAIANNIIEYFNFESIRTIHVYLPIRSRNEVDTFSIISLINHHYKFPLLCFLNYEYFVYYNLLMCNSG